ncbi:cell division cycle protein 123 homolog [Galendromus occidentalis]|uniref:Cell division cycle protein 123 homolog n=1 Tax=Galendromus occidentalis TaxID=34638 RepID=A0AAJ6QXU6_9ACAR|nr:cell division cycle protein 123 homolog [Galendromus occidentalis]
MADDSQSTQFQVPKVSREEILQCSFPRWYAQFEKVTPLSFVVELPEDFVKYLLSDDTIRLPGKMYEWRRDQNSDDEDSDPWSDIEDEDDLNEGETAVPKFEELSRKVMKKIRKLGGRCFPKLDWSSPKDASWIALNRTLSCSTFIDICLLLKSSSITTHDLVDPFEYAHPADPGKGDSENQSLKHHLILRKWVEIEPSFEFRCFVNNRKLIGISQRETSQVYSHIAEQKDQIVTDIVSFFSEYIENRFPLRNYAFDVFRTKKDYVRLLDFNPFCQQTDALLFTWQELHGMGAQEAPVFRFSAHGGGIRTGSYQNYALPIDVIRFAHSTNSEKLIDMLHIQDIQRDQQDSTDDDESS